MARIAKRMVEHNESVPREYSKPLPILTPLTEPFWNLTTKHVLALQACKKCATYNWYPRPWCVKCGSRELDWKQVSGLGTVYSFTNVYQVVQNSPGFEGELPFTLATVELDEGPRIVAQLAGIKIEEVKIGMRVKATFIDATEKISILKFSPV